MSCYDIVVNSKYYYLLYYSILLLYIIYSFKCISNESQVRVIKYVFIYFFEIVKLFLKVVVGN